MELQNYPRISAEIIPGTTPEEFDVIRKIVEHIMRFDPVFIDLTFGAGGRPDFSGAIRESIFKTANVIREFSSSVSIVPHLTANGLDIENTESFVKDGAAYGFRRYILLGGDPPREGVPVFPKENCYGGTEDLIKGIVGIHQRLGLEKELKIIIGIETEAPDAIGRTKSKIKAGIIEDGDGTPLISTVEEGLTQYYRGEIKPFLKAAKAAGIEIPIVPGIMLGRGYPNPKPLTGRDGNTILVKGKQILVDGLRVPMPPEFLRLFSWAERGNKEALEVIHKFVFLDKLLETRGMPRVHGYPHNRRDFFDMLEIVYPGIAGPTADNGRQGRPAPPTPIVR